MGGDGILRDLDKVGVSVRGRGRGREGCKSEMVGRVFFVWDCGGGGFFEGVGWDGDDVG